MTRFQALVADDEPLARSMLTALLKQDPEIESVIECADARGVARALSKGGIDIAFLDIEMPDSSGLDLAEQLGPDGPALVFVTAFAQYATTAFDVNATDYVLKPFSDARFFESVARAKRRVRERRLGTLASQLAILSGELKEPELSTARSEARRAHRLLFKEGDRSILLEASEVVWVEAEDYYVLIHSTRGRHMIRATMAALEQRLDNRRFLRVHRGALVNLDAVTELRDGGSTLLLTDGSQVPVSRSRKAQVEEILRSSSAID